MAKAGTRLVFQGADAVNADRVEEARRIAEQTTQLSATIAERVPETWHLARLAGEVALLADLLRRVLEDQP